MNNTQPGESAGSRGDACATGAGGCGSATSAKGRVYRLNPATEPMPKRVEKILRRWLRVKEQATALYQEAGELLEKALAETGGRDRVKLLTPGVVYRFSVPVTTAKGLKRTLLINDAFAQPQVSKMTVFSRWEVKMWAGDGPGESSRHQAPGTKEAPGSKHQTGMEEPDELP